MHGVTMKFIELYSILNSCSLHAFRSVLVYWESKHLM